MKDHFRTIYSDFEFDPLNYDIEIEQKSKNCFNSHIDFELNINRVFESQKNQVCHLTKKINKTP